MLLPLSSSLPTTTVDDIRLVIAARGVRAFAYGMLGVLLAVALSQRGLSPVGIGSIITVSLLGDFVGTYVIALHADRWGRRRTLVVLAALMALTGVVFGLVTAYPLLLIAGFFGTLGTSGSETAPFLPIEQAMMPQVVPAERRTAVFARYNLAASFAGALGALAASLPDLLGHLGVGLGTGIRLMFGLYVLAALAAAVLAVRLSPAVEAAGARPGADDPGRPLRERLTPAWGDRATSCSAWRRCSASTRSPVAWWCRACWRCTCTCASASRSDRSGCSSSRPTRCPRCRSSPLRRWRAGSAC